MKAEQIGLAWPTLRHREEQRDETIQGAQSAALSDELRVAALDRFAYARDDGRPLLRAGPYPARRPPSLIRLTGMRVLVLATPSMRVSTWVRKR